MAMEGLLQDLRDAVRQLRARPAFTVAVVGILGLGIGANTATFSLVSGLMLRPVPYADADTVVAVGHPAGDSGAASARPVFPYLMPDELQQLQDGARSFEHIAAYRSVSVVTDSPNGLVELSGAEVTPSLFPLLRTTPWLGRTFTEADAAEGAGRVVLLSHGAWTRRFGADPDIVGAPVELNDEPYAVIGVLPDAFAYPSRSVELWTPLVVPEYEAVGEGVVVIGPPLNAIARLRPEVSPEQAAAEARTLLAESSGNLPPTGEPEVSVRPIREELARPFRAVLLMLGAGTGLVLLVMCANVSGLLLVRGVVRQPELAIRGALGASRSRIARQLLVESVMLSVAGGAIGVAVAAVMVRAAAGLVPDYVPGLAGAGLDGTVLLFTTGLAVGTGVLSGTAPALAGSRVNLLRTLNEAGSATAGGFGRLRMNRTQAVLAVGQVAVALPLLIGAGLLLRSFVAVVTFNHGYEPAGILVFQAVNPASNALPRPDVLADPDLIAENYASVRGFAETLLRGVERIENLPGVDGVALARRRPIIPADPELIAVAGASAPIPPRQQLGAGIRAVSPGYADVLGLRVQAGRFFTDRDSAEGQRVVVVSESFAQRAFGDAPAVGQRLMRPAVIGDATATWEVIGVVDDSASPFIPADTRTLLSDVYVPLLQPGMTRRYALFHETPLILVRSDRTPLTVLAFLREVHTETYPTPSLDDMLWSLVSQPRFYAMCAGILGTVALLLAAFGLYGVLSHSVAQRRREIGIRMALGAGRRDVVGLVVRQGGGLVVAGVIIGLAGAATTTRLIEHLLFDVVPLDPLTYAGVTAVLVAFALLACWLPARRVSRIAPMDAVREA